MMQELCQTLERACQPAVTLTFDDGSRALVRPESGRLLGLYPSGSEESFFWMNPALARSEHPEDLFEQPGWINPGGDRTWLAPEIKLFIEDLKRPWETYAVQRALDPGFWRMASGSESELTLTNDTRVRLHRSGQEVGVRLRKNYRAAANPLQGTSLANAGLEFQMETMWMAFGSLRTRPAGHFRPVASGKAASNSTSSNITLRPRPGHTATNPGSGHSAVRQMRLRMPPRSCSAQPFKH